MNNIENTFGKERYSKLLNGSNDFISLRRSSKSNDRESHPRSSVGENISGRWH